MNVNIQAGTVIHGTLRPQDLLPALLDELERVAPMAHAQLVAQPFGPIPAHALEDDSADWWESEEAEWMLQDVQDELDAHAPDGMYFGTINGDGSDFGWWPID